MKFRATGHTKGFNMHFDDTDEKLKIQLDESGTTTPFMTLVGPQGYVGIGTDSPGAKLEVVGEIFVNKGATELGIPGTGAGAGDRIILLPSTGSTTAYSLGIDSNVLWYSVPSGASHKWYNHGFVKMVLDSNGNLGIGTPTPNYKLEVNGNFAAGTITAAGISVSGDITASNISDMQTKLDTIDTNANNYTYTLPEASSSTRGGIKIGYSESKPYYAVRLSSGKAYVDVPWVNTNTQRSDADIQTAVGGWYYSSSWTRSATYPIYVPAHTLKDWNGWYSSGSTESGWNTSFENSKVSILASEGVLGKWVGGFSDRRIKKNIEDVPDNKSLELLRNIPVRYYHYKDPRERERVIGFIAQEIRDVFPQAIHISPLEKKIPNILKNITNPVWEEKINEISGNEWLLTHFDLIDNSGVVHTIDIKQETIYVFYVQTTKPSLQTTTPKNLNKTLELIPDDNGHFLFKEKYEKCYLYGTKVNDFLCVDKQKLYALSFSATQEIDRIQQAEKTKLEATEIKLAAAEAEITTLKTQLAAVLARLDAIESN